MRYFRLPSAGEVALSDSAPPLRLLSADGDDDDDDDDVLE